MSDRLPFLTPSPKAIGVASDQGGFELRQYLVERLREAGHRIAGFGDHEANGAIFVSKLVS